MGIFSSKELDGISNFGEVDKLDLRTEEENVESWKVGYESKVVPLHEDGAGERALLSDSGRRPKVLFQQVVEKSKNLRPADALYSTTSSLYIKDMMSSPSLDEVLNCLSIALQMHMKAAEGNPNVKLLDIFDERKYPLSDKPLDPEIAPSAPEPTAVPDVHAIYKFVSFVFRVQDLPAEVAVLCIAYVERLIAFTGISIHSTNWRRVLIGALVIGTKVWEENTRWNVDFSHMFSKMTVKELNKLERQWLELLQYNVTLKSSQYAKYYFELRALSKLDVEHFPLEPLGKEAEERLEQRSKSREAKIISRYKKAQSMDEIKVHHHTRVVLQ